MELPCTLGESPLWHPLQGKLYWVDIHQCRIYSCIPHSKKVSFTETDKPVSALVPVDGTTILIALKGEIARFNTGNGKIETLIEIEKDMSDNRCNDGKCDPQGRFWIGTMDNNALSQKGSLFHIDKDLFLTKTLDKLTIANGMDWSPAGDKMYFIDSFDRAVNVYDFEARSGKISNGQTIIETSSDELPDGMCVDSEGMLWIAFWGGKRVGRYDPQTGQHLTDVQVPALNVTSCCFGGKDLTTLYITSARSGLSFLELKDYPLSGSVFSCETGIKGRPANFFNYSSIQ